MLNLVIMRSSSWVDIVSLREIVEVLFLNWRVLGGYLVGIFQIAK